MKSPLISFQPESTGLPIVSCIPEIRECLNTSNRIIVQAEPGAGKSTVLPLALINEPWLDRKKILMLEPRRLAAKSIATRMSDLLDEPVGRTVGYRVRQENQVSAYSRIEVLTEGILTRKLERDNSLEDVGLVIFDEFHERSIHADLALALCRIIQEYLRPDLRIIVMSATLNSDELCRILQAPVVRSEGRQYPVDVQYMTSVSEFFGHKEILAETVEKAVKKHEGDVLVFLPGEAEIRKCAENLEELLPHFAIHPLYSRLNPAEQRRAIEPDPEGKRKIVLATSIAETSITIEGVRIVVDSGEVRVSRFDPALGLSRLVTEFVSKDAADQRAGRAGRLGPGVCFRLWSMEKQARLKPSRTPEILDADLCSFYLSLSVWGFSDLSDLKWIDPPPQKNMDYAQEILIGLGALDDNGKITPHGRAVNELPCHPRLAHMLLRAKEIGAGALAADIAAFLEEKDPLNDRNPDLNLRLEELRRMRLNGKIPGTWKNIDKAAETYRKILGVNPDSSPVDPYLTGKLLAWAYPERIACFRPASGRRYQLANGQYAVMEGRFDLSREDWVAVAHLNLNENSWRRDPEILLGAPLNPDDVSEFAREKVVMGWDTRKGGLFHSREKSIGSILLGSKPLPLPEESETLPFLIEAVKKEGETLLPWDDEDVEQFQNRVVSVAAWTQDKTWPDMRKEKLLKNVDRWLTPFLPGIKRKEDFKKLPLAQILSYFLPYEKQVELEELAPAKIKVPSGSVLKLRYSPLGAAPVLEVRLQEVFGWKETPRINRGQVGIVLHLLSPGYKPVQITSNLESFWNNTYYEVRNELRRRYPKHAWPDDPWSARAVAKGRPTKN